MVGFRGPPGTYAGIAGADLENAPSGPVPFTSPFGLPVGRPQIWRPVVTQPGTQGGVPGRQVQRVSGNPSVATSPTQVEQLPYGGVRNGAQVFRTRSGYAPGPENASVAGGAILTFFIRVADRNLACPVFCNRVRKVLYVRLVMRRLVFLMTSLLPMTGMECSRSVMRILGARRN